MLRTAVAGATVRRGASAAKGPLRSAEYREEELPGYDEDEDEGIGMEEEGPARPLFGPALPPRGFEGCSGGGGIGGLGAVQWHWDDSAYSGQQGMNDRGFIEGLSMVGGDPDADADADIDDAASNEAADGDFGEEGSGQERLLEDFGDDGDVFGGAREMQFGGTPESRMEEDVELGFMGSGMEGVRTEMLAGDEDDVAEVRVDEGSEVGSGGQHMKMD